MVGGNPLLKIIAKEDRVTIVNHEEGSRVEKSSDDPLNESKQIVPRWELVKIDSLLDVFFYLWYDLTQ